MKPGDTIKVRTKENEFTGILMPNEETDSVIVKLDNGYNIGISPKSIVKKELLKNKPASDTKKETPLKKDPKKKTITVLHTGGTIASKVDYETGGVTAHFTASDLIQLVPEIKDIANIETDLVANMMSEDMNFSDYQKIAKAIQRHAKAGTDGIIIGHGTDTLTYTAAALAFMFEEIDIPVILVGSQRSSDRGSSDAAMNLICAAQFISGIDTSGVYICMHENTDDDSCVILPATKTRKMHTSRRDAFKPVNCGPVARIDYIDRKLELFNDIYKGNKLTIKPELSDKVGLIKTHTNMSTSLFEFATKNYKAIVIEGTGLGHAPTSIGKENLKKYEILKSFIKKGGIVAITSQCIYGRVHPTVYSNLRRLSNIGCIFCEDMLPETAYIKLSWLLGNYSTKETKELLPKNLRGEINFRLDPGDFY